MSILDLLGLNGQQQAPAYGPQPAPATGIAALSPQMQQLQQMISKRGNDALWQGLLQAGQPSPYKTNLAQAFGQALIAKKQAEGDINDQLLMAKIKGMTPKYEVTKDAFGNPIAYNEMDPSDTKPIGGSTGAFGLPTSQAGSGASGANPGGLTGDDFLKTLPAPIQGQVKALVEGRMAFPGGMAMKTPYWQQMLQAVGQYDPNFDAVNYQGRNKVYQDFTSGKSKVNLNAINTAINTLGQLQKVNEKLGGSQFGNTVRNFALDQMSDPNLVQYHALAKTAADEVTKAVVGGVGGTGEDRLKREHVLTANQSPEARKAGIQALITELVARADPLAESYNQGMGTTKGGIDLLTPESRESFNYTMDKDPARINASGVKTLQDAQAPGAAAVKPTLPPADAIAHLKANPSLAAAFEAKYRIPAKQFLGQ